MMNPMRIAILSPVWFAVPPSGYGGIEWIVSLLSDGLADAEPKTLEDIGRRLGLTRERVRQIETEALKRLAKLREMESVTL